MPGSHLVVNQTLVDPVLLDVRPVRRCALDECDSMCCVSGVYVFSDEVDDIAVHEEIIKPHLAPERRDVPWFDGAVILEEDHPHGGTAQGTMVEVDATHPAGRSCVFLRPDRHRVYEAEARLALGDAGYRELERIAAERAGGSPCA